MIYECDKPGLYHNRNAHHTLMVSGRYDPFVLASCALSASGYPGYSSRETFFSDYTHYRSAVCADVKLSQPQRRNLPNTRPPRPHCQGGPSLSLSDWLTSPRWWQAALPGRLPAAVARTRHWLRKAEYHKYDEKGNDRRTGVDSPSEESRQFAARNTAQTFSQPSPVFCPE